MAKDNINWIPLHRKIKENWLWQDSEKLKWWLDILISSNFADGKSMIKGVFVECKRGQCIKSLETWAKEWRTTRKTVSNFFKLLEKDGMIRVENVKVTTRLTICKYESYNMKVNADDPAPYTHTTPHPTRTLPTIEECKEGNNEENAFIEAEFLKFQGWLQTNTPKVLKMDQPFTAAEYERLMLDFYPDNIAEILRAMQNYKKLISGNSSANLTFRNWAGKRNFQKPVYEDTPYVKKEMVY